MTVAARIHELRIICLMGIKMRHSHRGVALSLILLSSFACGRGTQKAAVHSAPAKEVVIDLTAAQVASSAFRTAAVEAREASSILRLPGSLAVDPRRSWRVSPVVEAVVDEVGAAAHDVVRKGQVLARLRSAAVGDAQVAWLEARTNLRIASANRERNLGLRKQAVVSEAQWLQVDAEFQRAQVIMAQADHKLSRVGMSPQQVEALESAGRRFGEMALTSPADGVVLAATVSSGQALAAGESAFEIADLSKVWVTVHVPVASLAQVRPGAKATVRVSGSPRAGWDGVIASLGGKASAADQTVEGRIVVSNPGGFLRPGMYAEVDVIGVPVQALMVPSGAVFNVGNQAHVFQKVGETRFKPLSVTAGSRLGAWTPVSGPGIQAGVEVVVEGVAELKSHWLYAGGQ